jgi:hypothetical protein
MDMSTFAIKDQKPGRVLDGHVHDVLGFPEPVWPYSTHVKAQVRLREWLKAQQIEIWMPGQARASDDCVILFKDFREAFEALNENHALCLAVLLTDYLKKHGRKITYGNFKH